MRGELGDLRASQSRSRGESLDRRQSLERPYSLDRRYSLHRDTPSRSGSLMSPLDGTLPEHSSKCATTSLSTRDRNNGNTGGWRFRRSAIDDDDDNDNGGVFKNSNFHHDDKSSTSTRSFSSRSSSFSGSVPLGGGSPSSSADADVGPSPEVSASPHRDTHQEKRAKDAIAYIMTFSPPVNPTSAGGASD